MLKNNDVITVEITDLTTDAVGVGHYDGVAVFVAKTVPGDVVKTRVEKVKPNLVFAKKTEYITKSPDRCAPLCKNFSKCGGCQLMHINYDAQLRIKKKFIYDALTRIGGVRDDIEIDMIGAESPVGYRNKMIFPVGDNTCGFYENKSHNIVPLEDCGLGIISSKNLISVLLEFMKKYSVKAYDEKSGKGIIRRLFIRHGIHTGETMIVISANAKSIPHEMELAEMLIKAEPGIASIILNTNTKRTNLVLGSENRTLWGNDVIHDTLCGFEYEISPHSFFQINPVQTEKLYNKAIEYADINPGETVLDVYCGIGTISLTASKKAKTVTGIEIVPEAIENANKNAKDNGVTNCKFYTGMAEELVPKLISENLKPHKVIIDPPRKGSDPETLAAICSAKPQKIVYVSCNPATLARDVKFLHENGYEVEKVTGVDMFPETCHVETVALLVRTDSSI